MVYYEEEVYYDVSMNELWFINYIDIVIDAHRLQSQQCPKRNPVEWNVAHSILHIRFHRKYYQSSETVHTASCKENLTAALGFQVTGDHVP